MRYLILLALIAVAFPVASPLQAKDPCKAWKKPLEHDRRHVAKLTFHAIDVTFDGEIINNERHAKEIREGELVRFGDIECEDNSIDLEVISQDRRVKTRLRLLISEAEREAKGVDVMDKLLHIAVEVSESP